MHYHRAALLREATDSLKVQGGVYVDATFGGGGHSREILKRMGPSGKLIAFDVDKDACENRIYDKRFCLVNKNFMTIKESLEDLKIAVVDGILADLGVSSHQFDTPLRGFSMRFDAPLDMRMDSTSVITAKQVVNTYAEKSLVSVLRNNGEVRRAKFFAQKIMEAVKNRQMETTGDLKRTIEKHVPHRIANKVLAQVFQALRIEVNGELKSLEKLLTQSLQLLRKGGRLVLISYHSLEDRLVKHFLRDGNFEGIQNKDFYGNRIVPFKKVGRLVTPTLQEIKENPRVRSAKLRVAEKL
ncbi:ribosomal RNA small subunit methyltransferase H [Elysia marginata]|uniref:Ribosomal RNA small subunit methyltransferase H n=1 Tax=Elysia marginata TaxID=1093978 RepID=A0AAV4F291_9GAST|nr:ribosomal RNA small subunit methyltransferase H [Elysia marginata]